MIGFLCKRCIRACNKIKSRANVTQCCNCRRVKEKCELCQKRLVAKGKFLHTFE